MNVFTLPSFDRAFKKLTSQDQAQVREAATQLPAAFGKPHVHAGLGLRGLGPFLEFRAGLKLRVLFRVNRGDAVLVTVGDHDDIRRYVKENG